MPKVEIYTQPWCPFCERALHILTTKGVEFREIDAPNGSKARAIAFTPRRWAHSIRAAARPSVLPCGSITARNMGARPAVRRHSFAKAGITSAAKSFIDRSASSNCMWPKKNEPIT